MLPSAFLERMQNMLGEEYPAFLESFSQEKYQALRLNALKQNINGASATQQPEEVLENVAQITPVPWAQNGYYYEREDQPGKHPLHEAGVYYIQEPSAMAPVELLQVMPGDRVLDLCAAPGGKSTQIAAKLLGEGFLLCNEINVSRAKILSENVERMGIGNACVTNETPARLAEVFPAYFDKILVDAPCSGEGMFRKNEVACEEWSPENVQLCAERQQEILDCAVQMLRPGGRLVYSTCTFASAENEDSICRFLSRHSECRLVPIDKEKFSFVGADGLEEMTDTLRLWPHKIKGEGHYAAVLEKEGAVEIPASAKAPAKGGKAKGVSEKEVPAFLEFCQENLKVKGVAELAVAAGIKNQMQYITFGDNLYLVDMDMPSLKGLKVMRPGLHLGELKKNRFEPSHALALALRPAYALHTWNFVLRDGADENASQVSEAGMPKVETSADIQARAYLNGQTFPAEGEKGWYLVCVDGFGLGWGKLAGGIMKNHYPKGLRK